MDPGPLLILSGPSGSGKSTLISRLLREKQWPLRLAVSATTRPARPGELEGVHYFFWTSAQFQAEVEAGGFLEWADNFGHRYGTPRREVEPWRQRGDGVLLDIDVQGWEQVKAVCPDLVSVFVRTSSLETLERRLRQRRTESEEAIRRRLDRARLELGRANEYDYQVINDDLDFALAELRAILDPLFKGKPHAG